MSKQPREWGTPLWRILHSIAENIGFQKSSMLATDEANETMFILKFVEDIMPCLLCRKHYRLWKQKHPPETMSQFRGDTLREYVQDWLFRLHEEVNHQRGLESGVTKTDLRALYKDIAIGDEWAVYLDKIKLSQEMGLMKPGALQNFNRHLVILRKLIGKI
jgi:hypothetical protein